MVDCYSTFPRQVGDKQNEQILCYRKASDGWEVLAGLSSQRHVTFNLCMKYVKREGAFPVRQTR